MTNEDKYIESDTGITYKNYKSYKEYKVKILIYNNFDKISKDLTIVLDEPFTKSQDEILELLNDPNNFDIDDNIYDNSTTNFLNV